MKKNILFVIPYFIPAYSYGWPVKVAYDYAIKLIEKWYSVTVLTTDALDKDNRNNIKEEMIDWIRIIRLKNVSNYLAKYHNWFLPVGLNKWVKKNIKSFDIVHMHDFFTLQNIIAWKYCRKYNIPYVVEPHWSANFLPERWKSLIKKMFFSLFGNKLLSWSKSIIAVSKYEKNHIYTNEKDKIEILYNWIDYKEIDKIINSISEIRYTKFKDKYNLNWKKIILSMWRLHKVKRFDKLIDYSKDILLKNDEYCVVVAWPDEWELDNLKTKIHQYWLDWKMILTGWLYWKDKYIAYSIANIFTLLSDSEAGAVTVTDAIYFNLPLILSSGCNFEFPNKYTKVVNDNEAFKLAVEEFIDKKAEYSFWKEFDLNYLISKLEKIYDK